MPLSIKLSRRGVIIAAIVLACLVVFTVPLWLKSSLRKELDRIESSGAPAFIEDWKPRSIPDDDNLAHQLRSSFRIWSGLSTEINDWTARNAPLDWTAITDDQQASLGAIFNAHEDAMEAFLEAMQADDYATKRDSSNVLAPALLQSTRGREAIRLLDAAARLAISRNELERAFSLNLSQFKLSRLSLKEPFLLSWLTAMAMHDQSRETAKQIMQTTTLAEDQIQELTEIAIIHDLKQTYRNSLLTERAMGNSYYRSTAAQSPLGRLQTVIFARDQANYLAVFRHFLDQLDGESSVAPEFSNLSLARQMVETLNKGQIAYQRAETEMGAFRILLRIYELGLQDESDLQLEDLNLPPEQTRSPITNEPYRLERDEKVWMVLSPD